MFYVDLMKYTSSRYTTINCSFLKKLPQYLEQIYTVVYRPTAVH